MDFQIAFDIALGIVGFLGGWVLNSLKESLKALQEADGVLSKEVQSIQVLVVGQYMKREEVERFIQAVFHKLDKIEDLLREKEDKK
jgi:hypothetical protein